MVDNSLLSTWNVKVIFELNPTVMPAMSRRTVLLDLQEFFVSCMLFTKGEDTAHRPTQQLSILGSL